MNLKPLKYLAYILGGFVLLFALALTAVALFVNPNDFKPQIVKLVQEKKQRTLSLEGDIKLKLFPQIGLDLGKTRLSEHKNQQEFAALDSVQLYVAWLPLLRKELVVHKVTVEGVRANLIRFADGSTNIDDLLKKEEESEQIKFDIDSVKVTRSALSFDDRQTGRKLAATDLELKSGRIKDNIHTELQLDFKLTGDKPKLAAQIKLKTGLLFALKEKHYVLDDLDLGVTGLAAGISNLDLHAKGNIDARLAPQEIKLQGMYLKMQGQHAADKLDIALDAPLLVLTADKAEAAKLVLDATVQQAKSKLVAKLTLPDLTGNAKEFQVSQMQFTVSGQQGGNQIEGGVASPLRGNLESQSFSLPKLKADFDVRNPKFAQGGMKLALAGDARLDLKQQQISANLQTKLDNSNIQAKLGMRQFDNPFYTFDVAIDQLDVDRYLPTAPKTEKAETESPIDLSGLKSLRANGSVRIGSLNVANIKSSNVRLEVKSDGSRISISPLSANLYQGSMQGALSATASANPQITLQQQLTGISIGPLLKDVANKDLLEGRGNVGLNVTTQGATPSAMKRNLNGSAQVNLVNGAIKGINVAASLRKAQARLGMAGKEATQAASKTEQTDFSEMKASFVITNGNAHNEDLDAKSPLLRLNGNGDINIGADSMNYLAKATVVGTLEGQGGRELSQLKGIPVPIRISGALNALKYTLDVEALIKGTAKAKLDEQKSQIKEKATKKLFKGIFGR